MILKTPEVIADITDFLEFIDGMAGSYDASDERCILGPLIRWIKTPIEQRGPFEHAARFFLPPNSREVDSGTWWTAEEASSWASSGRVMRTGKRKPAEDQEVTPASKKPRKTGTAESPKAGQSSGKRSKEKSSKEKPSKEKPSKEKPSKEKPVNPLPELGLRLSVTFEELREALMAKPLFRDYVSPRWHQRSLDQLTTIF